MKLTFFGGAGTVTGANYLLSSGETKILIDCGLNQGGHYAERLNFGTFEYDPKEIKAVFVTHAHIDHTGRLPKLYKEGFRGEIYSTAPTKDFAQALLYDSEDILAREAKRESLEPLYTKENVDQVLTLWQTAEYGKSFKVGPFKITLHDAGHILGSSSIEIEEGGKKIVFSGDLGNVNPPLIKEGEMIIPDADYALIESAYGDRLHESESGRRVKLEDVIIDTVRSGGVLMIPAFAMERTQELIFMIHELMKDQRIPSVPVFLDSPLAIKLTEVYKKYESWFKGDIERLISRGDPLFSFSNLKLTRTTEESKAINDVPAPKIVIAGSGMSHGGRIMHHERQYLSDPQSAILFIGYQAKGSLGREILDGAETVKIFDEEVPVRCRKVEIGGYSAHADQKRLLEWLEPAAHSLKKAFVVQGDEGSSQALKNKIEDELAVRAEVPTRQESVELV
ncbi:MAG TPA: MBL fold metallo-hydrolase [Candidatus Tyrphobacter sp.]|nr:MBL fold metallo-hydrolase [Candidatus Tyrphobacter sp.]